MFLFPFASRSLDEKNDWKIQWVDNRLVPLALINIPGEWSMRGVRDPFSFATTQVRFLFLTKVRLWKHLDLNQTRQSLVKPQHNPPLPHHNQAEWHNGVTQGDSCPLTILNTLFELKVCFIIIASWWGADAPDFELCTAFTRIGCTTHQNAIRAALHTAILCTMQYCAIECNVVQLIAVQVYYAVQWNDMDSRL